MTDAARDYSETLFLPKTDFPMRAGLPQKEPELLRRWQALSLYQRLREAGRGRPRFILHDGPPYANGNIHIGHALNKILKDVVTRSQQMLGYDSNYVPGWDCHGLPIEWKIEEENYRSKNKPKPNLSDPAAMIAFRKECRAYAAHWIDVQREEFKRLGVEGDWDHPYTTMDFFAEAQIARELMKFAKNGTLYRGSKPVMWSVVEKTALAEAEVEYEDYTSDTVWVKFPVARVELTSAADEDKTALAFDLVEQRASVVIWTTTPWTLPGNRAISFSPKIKYALYKVTDAAPENWAKFGDRFVLSENLAGEVFKQARVMAYDKVADVGPDLLAAMICAHPLKSQGGYDFDVPLLAGDHVTDDTGTGFVHTAPGHGRDDFEIWTSNARALEARGINSTIPYTVDENGAFTAQAPGFTGKRVINDKGEKGDANEAVIKALIAAGNIIARGRLKHQYPHSWRSKKPVIFRNTPQWFIAMDKPIAEDPRAQGPVTVPSPLAGEGQGGGSPQSHSLASTPTPNPSPQGGWEQSGATASSSPLPSGEVGARSASGEGLRSHDKAAAPHPTLSASTSPQRGEVKKAAPQATLREIALREIGKTRWVPAAGENRINGMVTSKPDWVISRQRAWGVPITVFVREQGDGTVDILQDERVDRRIAEAFEQEGADAWYAAGARERFLGELANEDWQKVDDILDVWFDSGSTHAFVLEDPQHFPSLAGIRRRKDGGADTVMYLEGSDQHRGWFQSSLLESCGTRGVAPFDAVLTHGFVLDENGRPMSKSVGNVVAPQKVIKDSGADILRMWCCAADYSDDVSIGPEILKTTVDTYRRLRNTLRWMLGSLAHFREEDRVTPEKMPALERLMLHRLSEVDEVVRRAYADFDYKRIFAVLTSLMTVDLSAFYFDIRKDSLYCDPLSSLTRKSSLTVIDHLFRATVTWLAPMLPFTAEEAWLARYPSPDGSVHLALFPEVPAAWRDEALAEKWRKVRTMRRVVTGALEIERAHKRIGSSLEADPFVYVSDPDLFEALLDVDLAEICITSAATLVEGDGPADAFRLDDVKGVAVVVRLAQGTKCARSWKILTSVGSDPLYPDVSPRDAQALREWDLMRKAAE